MASLSSKVEMKSVGNKLMLSRASAVLAQGTIIQDRSGTGARLYRVFWGTCLVLQVPEL
jgi:hypothetical protein